MLQLVIDSSTIGPVILCPAFSTQAELATQLAACRTGASYVIPINLHAVDGSFNEGTSHWTALVVKDQLNELLFIDPTGRDQVYEGLLDSLNLIEEVLANNKVSRLFTELYHPQWVVIEEKNTDFAYVAKELSNDYDCGPFLVEAIRRLVNGETPLRISGAMQRGSLSSSHAYGQELRSVHQQLAEQEGLNEQSAEPYLTLTLKPKDMFL